MAIPEQEIAAYILSVGAESRKAERIQKVLQAFSEVLNEHGHSWPEYVPDKEDYEALRVKLKALVGKNPTQAYPASYKGVEYAEAFIAWHCQQTKEENTPMKNIREVPATEEVTHKDTVPTDGREQHSRPRGRNGGRKPIDGVKRSEKISLYITPELMQDIKALASIKGISITDCIIGVMRTYVGKNHEAIEAFFSVQSKVKEL